MTIKTHVKAGGMNFNHNETLVVRSAVKAGGQRVNHNESFAVGVGRKNLLLCRRFAQRMINERDLTRAPEFFAEGSVHHELAGGMPDAQSGPRALAQFLGLYLRAFPDLRIVFEDAMADRDRVVTRWRFEGTQAGPLKDVPASGRRVSVEGIRIDRIENGKIAESWMQMDDLALLEQIGALPDRRFRT